MKLRSLALTLNFRDVKACRLKIVVGTVETASHTQAWLDPWRQRLEVITVTNPAAITTTTTTTTTKTVQLWLLLGAGPGQVEVSSPGKAAGWPASQNKRCWELCGIKHSSPVLNTITIPLDCHSVVSTVKLLSHCPEIDPRWTHENEASHNVREFF